jgi:alkylated DNA nucleotide flippase Atl1
MVAARETTLQELLEGSKQYRVPLYQRTYSWTKTQLSRLWEDITQLAEDRIEHSDASHFIGSLVLAPSPSNGPTGVQEYLVVDGQQRLTTLTILLCAIRDHRVSQEGPEHRDRINQQYLINNWKPEQQRLKLVPTQADRPAYVACLDSTPQAGGSDPVGAAYRYFSAQLLTMDDADNVVDIDHIENVVISGLALVSVTAQSGDNAHRIFESLNNTGLQLTQADLLRNYLFMRLPTRGESVYNALWLPLQDQLNSKDLELLFWLDLVQRDSRIKQTDTYAGQQARLDRMRTEEEIEAEVARFSRLGVLLKSILDPTLEKVKEVRVRLRRLRDWGTSTVYPLLLHLLDRRDAGSATSEEITSAMLVVESFFVRRLLIGRATANLNRILLSVVTEMDQTLPVDKAVLGYLSTGRKYYASDDEIRKGLRVIPFYINGRPNQRSLVLQWLEESYASKEPVDLSSLTIEHVMPQTLTDEWRTALGDNLDPGESLEQVHEALVHTLGNLTLTGYNAKLSNSAFAVKRTQLATSGLLMNQEIARQPEWGRSEIYDRADSLAERVISVWPGPLPDAQREANPAWDLMNKVLAELPAGSWTTYGDLAAIIGSHPVAVGTRLATMPAPHAHRVLQVGGTVSPGFKWLDPTRTDDPQDLLRAEGVSFDEHGRASEAQRMDLESLAQLIGVSTDELPTATPVTDATQETLRDRFIEQLIALQGSEVAEATLLVLDAWTKVGGRNEYGTGQNETSCFLIAREKYEENGNIWPAAIYPSGKFEVVFQHLRIRTPFDNLDMREELRRRLNLASGVTIAAAKIELRPGFPLTVLVAPDARDRVVDALQWFYAKARAGV